MISVYMYVYQFCYEDVCYEDVCYEVSCGFGILGSCDGMR